MFVVFLYISPQTRFTCPINLMCTWDISCLLLNKQQNDNHFQHIKLNEGRVFPLLLVQKIALSLDTSSVKCSHVVRVFEVLPPSKMIMTYQSCQIKCRGYILRFLTINTSSSLKWSFFITVYLLTCLNCP